MMSVQIKVELGVPTVTAILRKAVDSRMSGKRPSPRAGSSSPHGSASRTWKVPPGGKLKTEDSDYLNNLRRNDIRADKVAAIKIRISNGTYEEAHKLAVAVDRLLQDLLGEAWASHPLSGALAQGLVASRSPAVETVLHRLAGRVNSVEGETAHLSLVDDQGREAFGSYSAKELASFGIGPASAFICTFTRLGNSTTVRLEPVQKRKLTADEVDRIREKTEQALGSYDPATDR
jgi:hypothetical protein